MALVGNILLGTGTAPGMSAIASAYAESAASSRVPWSALEGADNVITSISGSSLGGGGGGITQVYHDATLTGSGNSSIPLGVNSMELAFDSSLTRTVSGGTATVSVTVPVQLVSLSSEATGANIVYVVTGVSP